MATIQYQGRKTQRRGSEQRRQAILEAALRIIVKDGIRAVRHRAVAREADVPLSATTYYFKDINDLIADTFTLFAEKAMSDVISPFRDSAIGMLTQAADTLKTSSEKRGDVLDELSQLTYGYILEEVDNQRDHLVLEQAFYAEATINPELAKLAGLFSEKQQDAMTQACQLMGTAKPLYDGELLMSMILRLEHQLLIDPTLPKDEVESRLRHTLELIVPR